jgi:hypothetical protein
MSSNDAHDPTLTDERLREQKRVADFLAAPRKKRRSYIVTALTQNTASEYRNSIEHYVRVNFKSVALSHARNIEELKKAFGRQVVMVVYDDEFTDLDTGLNMINVLKRKKSAVPSSILFLTRQPSALIQEYNKILLPFHESDDYLVLERTDSPIIFSKIKAGLTNQSRRRSRRYKVDVPVSYFALNDDKFFNGRLTDLSIHGALLETTDTRLFVNEEQVKISIPAGNFLNAAEGDYLKLSARVRRVHIGGNMAGISFEHVSEKQLLRLTAYLSSLVNEQVTKAVLSLKLKQVK